MRDPGLILPVFFGKLFPLPHNCQHTHTHTHNTGAGNKFPPKPGIINLNPLYIVHLQLPILFFVHVVCGCTNVLLPGSIWLYTPPVFSVPPFLCFSSSSHACRLIHFLGFLFSLFFLVVFHHHLNIWTPPRGFNYSIHPYFFLFF